MHENARSGQGPSSRLPNPSRLNTSEIVRLATAEALCASLCSHLRVTARWSPGTLELLVGNRRLP